MGCLFLNTAIGQDEFVWSGQGLDNDWKDPANWLLRNNMDILEPAVNDYPGKSGNDDIAIIDPAVEPFMDNPAVTIMGKFTLGALHVGGASTVVDFQAGNLMAGANLEVQTTMTVSGGTINMTAISLTVPGTMQQSGGVIEMGDETMTVENYNHTGGILNIGGSDSNVITDFTLSETGIINMTAGTITVENGANMVAGAFNLTAGSFVVKPDFLMTGGIFNVNGGTFFVQGDLNKTGGKIEVDGGSFLLDKNFNHLGGTLELNGSTLTVNLSVQLNGSLNQNGTISAPRFLSVENSGLVNFNLIKNAISSTNDVSFGVNTFTGTCVVDNQSNNSWTWQNGVNAADMVLGPTTFRQSANGTMILGKNSNIVIGNSGELILDQRGNGDIVVTENGDILCSGDIAVMQEAMSSGAVTFGDGEITIKGMGEKNFSTNEPISIHTLSMGENIAAGVVGNLNIAGDLLIREELSMNDGIIDPNAGSLTLEVGAITVIGNDESYVTGPLNVRLLPGFFQNFEFPIGREGFFRPVDLIMRFNAEGLTPVTFTAELVNQGAPSLDLPNDELKNVSDLRYWDVRCTGCDGIPEVLTGATIELDFRNGPEEGVSDRENLRIAKTNADTTAWINLGGDDTDDDNVITSTEAFTEFSFFALANTLEGGNVLPVELTRFAATAKENDAHLTWTTATEVNNDYFLVEHSTDAATFQTLAQIAGAGDSREAIDYAYVHEQPGPGIHYYRLRQVDFDGRFEYSKVVTARIGGDTRLQVFPNPVADKVRVTGTAEVLQYTLFDASGRQLRRAVLTPPQAIDISDLPEGVYTLRLETPGGEVLMTERIVKQ